MHYFYNPAPGVYSMMDSVMGGRIKNEFQRAKRRNQLGMNIKLKTQI